MVIKNRDLLTQDELFNAGTAWLAFRQGNVDLGIHMILPVTMMHFDVLDPRITEENPRFASFYDMINTLEAPPHEDEGTWYAKQLLLWLFHPVN